MDREGWQRFSALPCRRDCMSDTIDVLLIDAEPGADQFWQPLLKPSARETFRVQRAGNMDEALAALAQTPFESILFDLAFPNAKHELTRIRACAPDRAVILIASRSQEEVARSIVDQV